MKANDNEILTIAGKRVRVAYSDNNNECCCNCLWNNKCLEAPERPAIYCRRYDKDGKYAYFVAAEEIANKPQTDANKNEPTREQKADFPQTNDADKAAEIRKININPREVRYVIDAIPSYAGIFMTEEDAKRGLAIFKAGMLAERERLMKEAPVADVIEMHGSTETGHPLVITLGFSRVPNMEYHGGAVRVIIEEIK